VRLGPSTPGDYVRARVLVPLKPGCDSKHPSTIFIDQDATMAGAIAYAFPNTSHRLCIWHIYLNVAKHLGHVLNKHKEFLPAFKSCVFEDRSEYYFNKKWHDLLREYDLEDNDWMVNLYNLRGKWAIIYHDSFTADMTSTQRSEGMNNVFKKRFRRKLGLRENEVNAYMVNADFLVECEKVCTNLRENEVNADFHSRRKILVTYSPNLPMLKTAAKSYTRRMYLEFETEFKDQFVLTVQLLKAEGSILTYMVTHIQSDKGQRFCSTLKI
jgi:zinc finger SWIM domain-containing protein 3